MRTYGSVRLVDRGLEGRPSWRLDAEPHILLRFKRIFERVQKRGGEIYIADTDEVRREIVWFLQRYALRVSAKDLKRLEEGADRHREHILRLEQIIDPKYRPPSFDLAVPARDYQKVAAALILKSGSLLLADDLGIGKTASAICTFTDPRALPAIVVTLSGVMPRQWQDELRKFAPVLTSHVLKKGTPYELPKFMGRGPDVLILNYHKLDGWAKVLARYGRSVVFDEVQELRRSNSLKYRAASDVAEAMSFRTGLSATPIYNYGDEIFNVLDVLSPGTLGTQSEFLREWCEQCGRSNKLAEPKAFGTYLRENFLMLRRTRKEVGRELPALQRLIQPVSTDTSELEKVEDAASELAKIILSEDVLGRGDVYEASQEFSHLLRQATGLAKAPFVAEFLRLLLESGERLLVYAWHRAVYDLLRQRLSEFRPVMFTGSETPAQKLESKRKFMDGETNLMLMSLRAGAGVDGLQKRCRTVVFAELDWSPGVHEQCVARIYRDGQEEPVTAYFLVADDGSDPVVCDTLGIKREQVEGLKNPEADVLEKLEVDVDRVKKPAQAYLDGKRTGRKARAKAAV